jgi:GGDEF domain-containing protein
MPKFYLRMEGVNLNNFVYEIQDLNVIRGGGLMLLDAVEHVARRFGLHDALATGASTGLFACEMELTDALKLRDDMQRFLNANYRYRHATFVVDVALASGNLDNDRERVLALNRWQQMTSPQFAVPTYNSAVDVGVCRFDLIRPATTLLRSRKSDAAEPNGDAQLEPPKNASASVKTRSIYGRNKKCKFLHEQVGKDVKHDSPVDLADICALKSAGNLHHKMAIIYIDGNGFGQIQRRYGTDDQRQREFDEKIKDYRRNWLAALVERMNSDQAWLSLLGNYRVEILQWGGDETCWVVPAWKGWELLSLLFEESKKWELEGEMLTHAAGMVFCHYNAPIQRLVELADELTKRAKEQGRDRNLFAYEILESFDHIGGDDLAAYRLTRSPQPDDQAHLPDASALILSGDTMQETRESLAKIKLLMPRRKLNEIVRGLLADPKKVNSAAQWEQMRAATIKLMASTLKELEPEEVTLKKLVPQLGGERAWWVHLNALWDYVG